MDKLEFLMTLQTVVCLSLQRMFCLTCRAAFAQLLLPAVGAALTQQLVVAHQQLDGGELVQTGLDGALLGAGGVTVGQNLERSLMVLMVEILSGLSTPLLIRRTVGGSGDVAGREAQVDFRNCCS